MFMAKLMWLVLLLGDPQVPSGRNVLQLPIANSLCSASICYPTSPTNERRQNRGSRWESVTRQGCSLEFNDGWGITIGANTGSQKQHSAIANAVNGDPMASTIAYRPAWLSLCPTWARP